MHFDLRIFRIFALEYKTKILRKNMIAGILSGKMILRLYIFIVRHEFISIYYS